MFYNVILIIHATPHAHLVNNFTQHLDLYNVPGNITAIYMHVQHIHIFLIFPVLRSHILVHVIMMDH